MVYQERKRTLFSHILPLPKEQAPHLIAAHLRVCSPDTAFRYYPTLEIRYWCAHAPGVLFPFGRVQFPGAFPRVYYGGLCSEQGLVLFVPFSLYEHRRRTLLWQLAQERLATANPILLHRFCQRAERELAEGIPPPDHITLLAEARARHVSYWMRFLAARQEPFDPRWSWTKDWENY